VPGDPKGSPLVRFVKGEPEDLVMTPKGERLPAAETALLSRWIEEGAKWPDGVDLAALEDKKEHWSLQPFTNPFPPTPKNRLTSVEGNVIHEVLA